MTGRARFSDDGRYRWTLSRELGEGPRLLAVLLNGSKANAERSDNTVTRLLKMAQLHGFGALDVGNSFGLMSPYPVALYAAVDPVGAECDEWLRWMANRADSILVGWGHFPRLQWRFEEVLALLPRNKPLYCLGRTKTGNAPRHPSRLAPNTPWEIFRAATSAV